MIWKQFNSVIILWHEELLSMFLIVFCHLLLAVFYIEFFCLFYSFHLQLAYAPPIKHWLQAHVFESRLSIPHHTWAWRHNLAQRTAARLCRYSENLCLGAPSCRTTAPPILRPESSPARASLVRINAKQQRTLPTAKTSESLWDNEHYHLRHYYVSK